MWETIVSNATPIVKFLAAADYTGLMLLVFIVIVGVSLFKLNKSANTKFFYDQLLVDENGKASTSKLAHMTALFVSTWAFIHLTLKGTLSEWYFLTYMTVWVLQRSYSKYIDLQKAAKEITAKKDE